MLSIFHLQNIFLVSSYIFCYCTDSSILFIHYFLTLSVSSFSSLNIFKAVPLNDGRSTIRSFSGTIPVGVFFFLLNVSFFPLCKSCGLKKKTLHNLINFVFNYGNCILALPQGWPFGGDSFGLLPSFLAGWLPVLLPPFLPCTKDKS